MTKPLRIASYNIHGGINRYGQCDLLAIQSFLDQFDIDIAVLQEVDTRQSKGRDKDDIHMMAGTNRPHHLLAPTINEGDGWYGNAIFSRYPITRSYVHNLRTSKRLEPRNAADALIQTPEGEIRIIGTHFSLIGSQRWSEANNLLMLMDQIEMNEHEPFILCGDFNEWRWRSKMIDHLNSILTPHPVGASFPSRFPIFHLDRVWSHSDREIINVQASLVKDKKILPISDHCPLIIEVGFSPS